MYGALKGHGKGHKYEMGGEKCFNVLAQKIGSFPQKITHAKHLRSFR